MLLLAKQRNWNAVAELEAERQLVITALFSHPQIAENLSDISSILMDVIEVDRESILLGEHEQVNNSREMTCLHKSKHAVFAYLDNS
jgi:hypothetical protein